MEVKIISATKNPMEIMWTAARTCYSAHSPISIFEDTLLTQENNIKTLELVKKVLQSGHLSIAEHVNFTFAIEGISRACSHQLVRHRHCTFSQQSQRYVEIKENYEDLCNVYDGAAHVASITDKYFVPCDDGMSGIKYAELETLKEYRRLIEEEHWKPEDARAILPNATKTNIIMTCNLRELMHMCNLRLCTRAQKEIRELFYEIKRQVTDLNENIGSLLVPACEVDGFCKEHKSCGRKPMLSTIMEYVDRRELV